MNFAVIRIAGKQYLVNEGDTLKITLGTTESGKPLPLKEVLLLSDESGLQIGTPLVSGAVVQAKVLGNNLGPKIRVAKFKAKSRYRRVTGFRAHETTVQIEKIGVGKETAVKSVEKSPEKVSVRKPRSAKA